MTEARSQPCADNVECASPPCLAGEFETAAINKPVLIDLLNDLIEGERAGAQGLLKMAKSSTSLETQMMLRDIATDEARYCAVLSHHVERLGGTPNRNIGEFAEKLAKRDSLAEKLALLDKGQSVVVRILDETIPTIPEGELKDDLIEMRDTHVKNIARCKVLTS